MLWRKGSFELTESAAPNDSCQALESSANEENLKRATQDELGINVIGTSPYNIRKPQGKRGKKTKKINNREDEWQGRNLLSSPTYDDDDMLDVIPIDVREMDTMMKYQSSAAPPGIDEPLCRQHHLARKNSKSGRLSLARSRDGQLEDDSIWMEADAPRDRPRSRRDLRHKRAKSGQWDPPTANRSFVAVTAAAAAAAQSNNYVVPCGLHGNKFTQSAPDILSLFDPVPPCCARNGDAFCCQTEVYRPHEVAPSKIARSSTIGNVPPNNRGQRYPTGPPPPRTSSRGKIRSEVVVLLRSNYDDVRVTNIVRRVLTDCRGDRYASKMLSRRRRAGRIRDQSRRALWVAA
ncbi:hypothetical protein LSH36_363g02075 [Paralvinella palmiformis]|uniref:Uncharacterized protein n=1 Tax=Paralvinella palmiformis TaxID=53620 RepID=A0AAD9JF22_9ANNE|nr:hypothetical protein LSH36_363g02075 [Paralvinella palmiformis]